MNPIAPSFSAQGSQAARQKPGAESAPTSDAFSALLAGLADAVADGGAPVSKGTAADEADTPDLPQSSIASFSQVVPFAPQPPQHSSELVDEGTSLASREGLATARLSAKLQGFAAGGLETEVQGVAAGALSANQQGLVAEVTGAKSLEVAAQSRGTEPPEFMNPLGSHVSAGAGVGVGVGARVVAAPTGAAAAAGARVAAGEGALVEQTPATPKASIAGASALAGSKPVSGATLQGMPAAADSPIVGRFSNANPDAIARAMAATSAEGLGSSSLIAQTARMDLASSLTANGRTDTQRLGATLSRSASNQPLAAKMRPLAQALDATSKMVSHAQTTGAAAQNNPTAGLRAGNESSLLRVDSSHVFDDSRSSHPAGSELAALPPMPLAAGVWAADPHRERSQLHSSDRAGPGSAIGVGWGDAGAPRQQEVGTAGAEGMAPSPEEALSEQVTYWLSENLKNAEVTVEHAGQPVEVRVSLAGNEAHVSFRSDQIQTRELLGARMEQLRELLLDQGLVLSGASVDTGASGHSGEPNGKNARDGARTARVQPAIEAAERTPRRTLTSSSVDLYV